MTYSNNYNWYIGGNDPDNDRHFNGNIRFVSFTLNNNLFAEYNFSEGTGNTLTDSVGNNNGTINGATWNTLYDNLIFRRELKTLDDVVYEGLSYRDIFDDSQLISNHIYPFTSLTNWNSSVNSSDLIENNYIRVNNTQDGVYGSWNGYSHSNADLYGWFNFIPYLNNPSFKTARAISPNVSNLDYVDGEEYLITVLQPNYTSSVNRFYVNVGAGGYYLIKEVGVINLSIFTTQPTKEKLDLWLNEYLKMRDNGGSYVFTDTNPKLL
jgi:hypothetical protein